MPDQTGYEDFIQRVTEPGAKTHLVTWSLRPGIASFFAFIEYNWYPPDSIKNELFGMQVVEWETAMWLVVSVPTEKMAAIRDVANMLRLRIADGVPTMIGGKPEPGDRVFRGVAVKHFPGSALPNGDDNPCMFAIESSITNPLHNRENRLLTDLVLERERAVISAFERGKFPKPLEIYNFIYGFDPHPEWL